MENLQPPTHPNVQCRTSNPFCQGILTVIDVTCRGDQTNIVKCHYFVVRVYVNHSVSQFIPPSLSDRLLSRVTQSGAHITDVSDFVMSTPGPGQVTTCEMPLKSLSPKSALNVAFRNGSNQDN